MSGRKIDDHSFWAGKGSNGSVFPMGAKTKPEHSTEGFGELGRYEDTTEEIATQQKMNKTKVHGHPRKPLHRN